MINFIIMLIMSDVKLDMNNCIKIFSTVDVVPIMSYWCVFSLTM